MLEYYHRKGYSDSWINQRLQSIEIRKELTDEWERRGIKKRIRICRSDRYHHAGMGRMTTKQYKQYKGLKTIWSWSLIACGSHYDRNIEREETEDDHRKQNVARQGGAIAGNTRKEIEAKTGKKVISQLNAKSDKSLEEAKKK